MKFPEEVLAATEDACQRQPLQARMRMALLRLEKEGHRAGWDSPPNEPAIFRVDRDEARGFVRLRPSRRLTTGLGLALGPANGGEAGAALQNVASSLENARKYAEAQFGVARDQDIPFDGPPRGFYGYAMRFEGWTVASEDEPERLECRMVHAVTRDGLTWWVLRLRRRPPVRAVMTLPEADFAGAGLVPNALGRMVNAVAGNIVPVPHMNGAAR